MAEHTPTEQCKKALRFIESSLTELCNDTYAAAQDPGKQSLLGPFLQNFTLARDIFNKVEGDVDDDCKELLRQIESKLAVVSGYAFHGTSKDPLQQMYEGMYKAAQLARQSLLEILWREHMIGVPYAIVFSGGGALGAWEVGCYKAIRSRYHDHPPEVVTGASAGALNAAGICAGMSPVELQHLWSGLTPENVYLKRYERLSYLRIGFQCLVQRSIKRPLQQFLESSNSIFDTTPLRQTLAKTFRDSAQSFFQSPTRFAMSLTDLSSRAAQYFYKVPTDSPIQITPSAVWKKIESIEMLIQGMMGTTALPVLFPPFEGRFDGGVLLNQPISPAIDLGALNLFVLIPTPAALGETTNLFKIGDTVVSTWLSASLVAQIKTVRLRNEIRGLTGQSKIRVCVIRPQANLEDVWDVSLLSFGQKVKELIDSGEQAANYRLDSFDPEDDATWY